MEMDYWRRSSRKTQLDKIRNDDNKKEIDIDMNIIETIEANRLKQFGHVNRMWLKKIVKWIPSKRKKRDRPERMMSRK